MKRARSPGFAPIPSFANKLMDRSRWPTFYADFLDSEIRVLSLQPIRERMSKPSWARFAPMTGTNSSKAEFTRSSTLSKNNPVLLS